MLVRENERKRTARALSRFTLLLLTHSLLHVLAHSIALLASSRNNVGGLWVFFFYRCVLSDAQRR